MKHSEPILQRKKDDKGNIYLFFKTLADAQTFSDANPKLFDDYVYITQADARKLDLSPVRKKGT